MNKIIISESQTVVIQDQSSLQIEISENLHVDVLLHYQKNVNIDLKITVGENATANFLHFYDVENINEKQTYYIEKNSEVKIGYAYLHALTGEKEANVYLVGEHSKVEITSGILAKKHLKIRLNVEHQAKHTYANMEHYAVVSDLAYFNLYAIGKICEKMSGSAAHQTSRILTMAKNHHCEVTPVLIIDENDVAASHANSIGQPDDLQLYYLQSRGLTIDQSLNLISSGYLEPIVLLFEDTTLNETIKKIIEEKVSV